MKKPRPIFLEPWFSRGAFSGLNSALHGNNNDTLAKEGSFMSEMILWLLDSQRSRELFNRGLYDFYAFCQQKIHMSHSQIYQDLWILYMTKEMEGGFFVEFGACDGVSLSNTLLLEKKYNWTGVLAEPNPYWHLALDDNRQCLKDQRCVARRSGEKAVFFHVHDMPELSRLGSVPPDDIHERNGNRSEYSEIEVETVSLQDLLDQHKAPSVIDYLSIDTEGSEESVLLDFDFKSYLFKNITIEHAGDLNKRSRIKSLLEANGYRRWRPELSRWDDWYILDVN